MHIFIRTWLVMISIFTTYVAVSQSNKADCATLQNGTFFSYPKNTDNRYITKREGTIQYEKDMGTGDSNIYKIEWVSACKYTLKLTAGNIKMTPEVKEFWDDHKLFCEITSVTGSYYTYNAYADKSSNVVMVTDTMWMNEKINPLSNVLTEPVKSELNLKRAHFSDTSQYAVLYIYRNGKFAAYMVDMLIYFDNNLICSSKNNSTYIFKIKKEGNFNLVSVSDLNKKSATLPLTVKFGQKYYVSSSAKLSANMLSIYTPALKLMDADKGAEEFQNAY